MPNKHISKKLLNELYWNEQLSFSGIAKKLKIEKKTVLLNMRKNKIKTRTIHEGVKLAVKQGRWNSAKKDKNHFNWKGGKLNTVYGYKLINIALLSNNDKKIYASMFFGHKKNVVFEHRIIIAKKICRPLKKTEEVHHLNGIKDDNRLENLLLLDGRKHKDLIPALNRKIKQLEDKLKKYEK